MDLSSMILTAIENTDNKQARQYIGSSSIGHPCNRYLWYAYHNAPSIDETPVTQISFEIGRRLENMILDYIEKTGINIIRPHETNHNLLCRDNEVPEFQGHMDGVMVIDNEPCVLEIKTAKSTSFQNFVKKGLEEWSRQYYAQLQSYMGMRGYKKGVLLAVNKDTSELHHEWVEFDSYYYNNLVDRAKNIHQSEEPPIRINKNPTYYLCARCKYKDTCFYEGAEKQTRRES